MSAHSPVVGIATEHYVPKAGFSLDLVAVDIPDWGPEHQRRAEGIQRDLGYFTKPIRTEDSVDEYPAE
jgi:hypothetical protein